MSSKVAASNFRTPGSLPHTLSFDGLCVCVCVCVCMCCMCESSFIEPVIVLFACAVCINVLVCAVYLCCVHECSVDDSSISLKFTHAANACNCIRIKSLIHNCTIIHTFIVSCRHSSGSSGGNSATFARLAGRSQRSFPWTTSKVLKTRRLKRYKKVNPPSLLLSQFVRVIPHGTHSFYFSPVRTHRYQTQSGSTKNWGPGGTDSHCAGRHPPPAPPPYSAASAKNPYRPAFENFGKFWKNWKMLLAFFLSSFGRAPALDRAAPLSIGWTCTGKTSINWWDY